MASPSSGGDPDPDPDMKDLLSELKAHLKEKVIPELASGGALGKDARVVGVEVTPVGGYGLDHWMSHSFKVAVSHQDPGPGSTAEIRTSRMIAKYAHTDAVVWCEPAIACRNEEFMYNQVVPFFEALWQGDGRPPLDLFPKCYRASAGAADGEGSGSGCRPVVVMADLSAEGFRLPSSPCTLDAAHAFLALQRLGKMHALSYCAKARRKSDFLSLARQLGESNFTESKRTYHAGYYSMTVGRGLSRLASRADGSVDAATVEHLRRRLHSDRTSSPALEVMLDARSAEEPLAVIAHGDFCRNNLLFKYDDKTGKPIDVRLIDLQNAKYCSPTVDLSFFLFLNTTPLQRSAHWDDFFVAYYDGLSSTMRSLLSTGSDPTLSPTMDIPSLASLRADFARHALYGHTICSFFLPVMQAEPGACLTAEEHAEVAHKHTDPYEVGRELGAHFSKVGGEAADDCLADLLLEFVDRGLVGL